MSVSKPFAFIKGTTTARHASEVREGEEYEWNGVRVFPVMRKFFRYEPREYEVAASRASLSDPRESAAHLVTKTLLVKHGRLFCMVGDEPVMLQMREVVMEQRIDNRRPDVTGVVQWCTPYWHLAGLRIHIEVHFTNAVRDKTRIAALQELGDPVLEFHLPKKYLRDAEAGANEPTRFRALLAATLTSGFNAGTWISRPRPAPPLVLRNAFTGAVVAG